MAIPNHTNSILDGSNPAFTDRLLIGVKLGVANAAGSGAGAAVVVPISFPGGELPANYAVSIDAGQPCIATPINKTANGFSVSLLPYPATATLAAGTIHVIVEA